jgi:hypothetical protein
MGALADTAALAAALVEAAVDSAEAEVDSAEAAAAVGGEGENHEKNINQAISICWRYDRRHIRWRSVLFSVALLLFLVTQSIQGQALGPMVPRFSLGASGCGSSRRRYRDIRRAALKEILGPNSHDLIYSDEIVRDRETAMEFGKLGEQRSRLPCAKNKKAGLAGCR